MPKKAEKVIRGFEVIKPFRECVITYLESYHALSRAYESFANIDGTKNSWCEKVLSKAAVERHLFMIEDALEQIPEKYRKPVMYTFAGEPLSTVRIDIELEMGIDYGDVIVFREKLIYFVAKNLGFPVSEKGEEWEIEVQSDGEIIVVSE